MTAPTHPQPVPELIAHRGHARVFPENTLPAIQSALDAGARCVEIDVQLCADAVPVLMHDPDTLRTSGVRGRVMDMSLEDVRQLDAGEASRLGSAFRGTPVPTLADVADLVQSYPDCTLFVELKRQSLDRFGCEVVVRAVLDAIAPIRSQCVLISFDRAAVVQARAAGAGAIGWVINAWGDAVRRAAARLEPEYLFADVTLLPRNGNRLWSGSWRWAIYEVTDPTIALRLAARGVDLVETMAIAAMLADPRLKPGGSRG